jgi:hypothetical protein
VQSIWDGRRGSGTGRPRAVVLFGEHGVELAAQVGLDRGVGGDALDGAFQLATPGRPSKALSVERAECYVRSS